MVVKLGHSHWGRNVGWGCLRIGCRGEYLGRRGTRLQARHVSGHHTRHHQDAMYTFPWLKYLLSKPSQNLEGHNYHHTHFTFLTLHSHFFPCLVFWKTAFESTIPWMMRQCSMPCASVCRGRGETSTGCKYLFFWKVEEDCWQNWRLYWKIIKFSAILS